ncbi:MAG: hypothetical protein K6F34_06435 [Lachnospiraceae bacterium]|nr:hypothetical protein [Lachnospiraceae bacterium]
MKRIKEDHNIKRILMTCSFALLLPVILTSVILLSVSAGADITLTSPDKFYGRDKCLTVTVTGNADGHEIGLIAEGISDGAAAERRFETISCSGDVKFDAFTRGDLFKFRVIAVDKSTLAPVCGSLTLTREPGDDEIDTNVSNVNIPALPAGTSTALKAVTKDLILAQRALASLEALSSNTVTLEYTEDVVSEETDGDGVTVTVVTQETKTAEFTVYDAISVNDAAYTTAGGRLDAMVEAYEKLRTSAAVLYQLAGENTQLKSYALQAGDIATEALGEVYAIESDFTTKRQNRDQASTGFLAHTAKIDDAHKIIRISGGTAVLIDGGFCTYPKGADLALVSDANSSAVILEPDNGKVTNGTAVRSDFAADMSKIVITSGDDAAELATITSGVDPCFRKYDGFEASENTLATVLTTLEYVEAESSETAVNMLTAYAKTQFATASYGTHETYDEIVEAFLSSADDSEATLAALAGGSLEAADDAFEDDLTAEYNGRRGYTEYWSCGNPADLYMDYYGIHCTVDANGNLIGKYEGFEYGVKDTELYFVSPVPDKNGDHIPDSRAGCVYEKIWRLTDYTDPYEFDELAHQPGYDPSAIRTHLYETYEYSTTTKTRSGGPSNLHASSYDIESADEEVLLSDDDNDERLGSMAGANDYDDPEGEPSVQVCHFKRYYDNASTKLEIESVAVYNPAIWEYYKSIGMRWDQARSRCYDILRQKDYAQNGWVKREYTYVGSMPGYDFNDVVVVKDYDLTGDSPMLAYEYHESAMGMFPTYYAYLFQNFDWRSASRAYYTPDYFASWNDRTKRVPADKRELFYGKTWYYRSSDGSMTGYNFLGSWKDPEEYESIQFHGADHNSFLNDNFLIDDADKNVGIWHFVLREDNTIKSSYELIYRRDEND